MGKRNIWALNTMNNKDLFGVDIPPKEISVSVYCDERMIDAKVHPNKESWVYITLLVVPDSKKSDVLTMLNRHRADIKHYGEVKFHKLRKGSHISTIARLAKLWLQEITNDANMCFYFKVFGIKRDNLLFELFSTETDPAEEYGNIYNRFFRMTFLGALNSYWSREEYKKVVVSGLFHHKQRILEAHGFFPWHLCYKVSNERIAFQSNQFVFIESDHNVEPNYKDDSQFIQLADILVGSISHCLDLPTRSNVGKNEVAKVVLPLVRDILGNVYSKRSCFDYFRKYDVSFYPSKKLTRAEFSNDVTRAQSCFFKNRRVLLEERVFGKQLPLAF